MDSYKVLACAFRARNKYNPSFRGKCNEDFVQMLEIGDYIANSITTVSKDSMIIIFKNKNYERKQAEDS